MIAVDNNRKSQIARALRVLEEENFKIASGWHALHDIVGPLEGDPQADRIHALLHRIEGDEFNARYWYRKAGIEGFDGSFEEEASAIAAALELAE